MFSLSWLSGVVAVTATGVLCTVFYRLYLHPLSKIPGPRLWAISDVPWIYHMAHGTLDTRIKTLHDIYGASLRTGTNRLSFTDASAWKDIYASSKGQPAMQKDPTYYKNIPGQPASIVSASDADHPRMRRLISHAFSEKALREHESTIQKYVDLFISGLRKSAAEARAVDMTRWYNWTTFDILGDLAFGEPFNCLEDTAYHQWVSIILSGLKGLALLRAASLLPGFERLCNIFIPKSLLEKRRAHLALTFEKVERRLQMKSSRADIMSYIMRYNDERGMSVPELKTTAHVLIIAGSETTASLLTSTTFYLLRSPVILETLTRDIRNRFPREDEITMLSVAKIDYLLAVFNEAFRMHPPVASGLPRIVPVGGAAVAGTWVPGGISVSVHALSAYRSSKNFNFPDLFLPQRWLGDTAFASDNREALKPFSIGPRDCIGKSLAYSEMRLIMTKLLWNFDLELMDDSKEWATSQKLYIVWQKRALNVRLTPAQR